MTEQIELVVGQTWVGKDGLNREITYLSQTEIRYSIQGDTQYTYADDVSEFSSFAAEKLIPKTVRKSQCVMKHSKADHHEEYAGFFGTEKDARNYCEDCDYVFIMWPLVVNGVEQWVEVPEL